MIREVAAVAAVALGLSGAAAHAATLSFTGTGQTATISNNDLGLGLNGQTIDIITGDLKSATNGLSVTAPAKITFTYLGFEAGNKNFAAGFEGTLAQFVNGVSTVGDTITVTQSVAGLVSFLFGTTSPVASIGLIANNGVAVPPSPNYAIGYVQLSSTSWLALFDDIAAGDRDFDDIGIRIDVAPIPLPAGGLLLLGALGALAVVRRRRAEA